MMSTEMVFWVVVCMSVGSAVGAIVVEMSVDTAARPSARRIVDRLMQLALLTAGAVVALLGSGTQ